MKSITTNLKWSALLAALLVLPFMLLEWINRRLFHEAYPLQLFTIMWLLALAICLILLPIVKKVRDGDRLLKNPLLLSVQVVSMVLIAWLWVSILMDQLDCFLGVPLCD